MSERFIDGFTIDGIDHSLKDAFAREEIEQLKNKKITAATETDIGGIIASQKTDEYTEEVKIDPETNKLYVKEYSKVVTDDTLTESGQAADANVTGEKISELKNLLNSKADGLSFNEETGVLKLTSNNVEIDGTDVVINLNKYYTKEEVDSAIDSSINELNNSVGTELEEINESISGKASGIVFDAETGILKLTSGGVDIDGAEVTINLNKYYTKEEVNSLIPSLDNYYTKEEADNTINELIQNDISDINSAIESKADGLSFDSETGVLKLTSGGVGIDDSSVTINLNNYYTKQESDEKNDDLKNAIDKTINAQSGTINNLEAKISGLGNLVSDVTEEKEGLMIHYSNPDISPKIINTKDTSVKVEDVNRTETGISIVYSDGETKDIEISGGGGGGGTSSVFASITRITPSSTVCVYGDAHEIKFSFNSSDAVGDDLGDGTATWYVGSIKKATSVVHQGDNTFDIGQYLNVGTNSIRVTVEVKNGDEVVTASKTWTVNAINMYAVWDYDDTIVNETETVAIRWTPYGDINKTTHIKIDGVEVATSQTTRSGVQQYVMIEKYPHGSHMVELYLTATINDNEIRSNSIFHDMIFVDSNNNSPIVSSSCVVSEMTQYNTLNIPVVIYNPQSLTSNATLAVNGNVIANWTNIDRTIHYWNYTPSEAGAKSLTITCGETVKTINLSVVELDIDNEEVGGYAFKLNASEIAGNDALKVWNSNGVTMSFSDNFDWDNGGILSETDDDGNIQQFMRVKAGTTATIDYELFGNDAKLTGKNFKVIFKVTNSRDADAVFLNCMSDGIGVELGANKGVASSELVGVSTQYAEDSYVEFEYEIYPSNNFHYIKTFIDGVMSSANIYVDDDNFTQINKKKIVIGSEDCDVNIYMVKVYESYLTMDDHIINFIADAPNAKEMVTRYNRNDILSENGEISFEKLARQNPDARIHLYDIPRMTQGKKDYVEGCTYQQIYTNGTQEDQLTADGVRISIQGTSSVNYRDAGANTDAKFTNGFTDGNGKHIDGYSMTKRVEDKDGTVLVAGSIPVNYFNTKVNIASCENINNMCLAEFYNRYQPYMSKWRRKNDQARDCMEHHIGVQFIKDQSHGLFNDDNYHMYAICNMGNSKKNLNVFHDEENPLECCIETCDNDSNHCMMLDPSFDVATLDSKDFFEFRYPDIPTDEMKNAFVRLVRWFANGNPANATGEALSEAVTFGPYTFRGIDDEDVDFEQVLKGTTISTYAGTYTHDTYEYRMAKMLSECEDYLIMDAMVYHYCFVEQHAMVDNVAKNTFWGTEDLVHWQLIKNYDNDTGDGNDNNGLLIVPFGCEGFDKLTDVRDVFNGNKNVYWGFIFGIYEARRTMWVNRESKGAWDKDAYIKFTKDMQNILPERVYNQDYWYKYLRLYETNGVDTYLPKLEGGKKNHQREAYVTNNYYYNASQYMGTACVSKSITLRGYTPENWSGVEPKSEVSVALYQKGYIVVQVADRWQRVKANKGEFHTIYFQDGDMNDTVINIHGANIIQSIGDVSCLYIGYCDFSAATKLRSLQIGSMASGYQNANLSNVGFKTNTMLEELYIQNCPNANIPLDLSGCQALRVLDIRGSGFTGITFALGGLLEDAKLNSPTSLTMRGLHNLTDEGLSLESHGKITSLRIENCNNIDTLGLINRAENLNRIRLIGIDWVAENTSILNRMAILVGIDDNGYNVSSSIVTGSVHIIGFVRQTELDKYANTWTDLEIQYDAENVIPQHLVTYYNADGTKIYEEYIDRGLTTEDPVQSGAIGTPTRESTESTIYTFNGWDFNFSTKINKDTSIYARYEETTREYTVSWYLNKSSRVPICSAKCLYGSGVDYDEDRYGIPSYGETTGIYRMFTGWDRHTGYITGDTNVYAVFEESSIPVGKTIAEMTPVEINAMIESGVLASNGGMNADQGSDYYGMVTSGDELNITMGHDYNFDNIESIELISTSNPKVFDGTNYYRPVGTDRNNILLFDRDKSFTLAIDFEFRDANTSIIAGCYSNNTGFELLYNDGGKIRYGNVNSANIANGTSREIVVIRHEAGTNIMHIYSSNKMNNEQITTYVTNTINTYHSAPLTFGALSDEDGYIGNHAKGTVYWSKLWYADIGETYCKKIASWPRQSVTMQVVGTSDHEFRTFVRTDNNRYCNCSFLMKGVMDQPKQMNNFYSNTNGWSESDIRTWLNNRIPNAMPDQWRYLLKKVKVNGLTGNNNYEDIITTEDYIWLPAANNFGWESNYREYHLERETTAVFNISTDSNSLIKKDSKGTSRNYWTRTPIGEAAYIFVNMYGYNSSSSANSSYYVCYGFCI